MSDTAEPFVKDIVSGAASHTYVTITSIRMLACAMSPQNTVILFHLKLVLPLNWTMLPSSPGQYDGSVKSIWQERLDARSYDK